MPKIAPSLTNRGPAGLLAKLPEKAREFAHKQAAQAPKVKPLLPAAPINNITPSLLGMVVDIETLVPDPMNARLHPERNIEALKESLLRYGQVKPLVVRRSTNVVTAGNGTMEAAKALGWTKIAATFVDFNDVDAVGFGLADNRTAELAKWDFEVVARLDKLLLEAGDDPVGWSQDELEVLRADWSQFQQQQEQEEGEEVPEQAPGDAELLMQLKVTVGEPETKVTSGEVWKVGRHTLIIADVVRGADQWKQYLADGMLFLPYPGPLMLLTEAAKTVPMLLVQPDCFIAGHLLDHYKTLNGDTEVSCESAGGV